MNRILSLCQPAVGHTDKCNLRVAALSQLSASVVIKDTMSADQQNFQKKLKLRL